MEASILYQELGNGEFKNAFNNDGHITASDLGIDLKVIAVNETNIHKIWNHIRGAGEGILAYAKSDGLLSSSAYSSIFHLIAGYYFEAVRNSNGTSDIEVTAKEKKIAKEFGEIFFNRYGFERGVRKIKTLRGTPLPMGCPKKLDYNFNARD